MDVACNGLLFTLGRVLNVDNDTEVFKFIFQIQITLMAYGLRYQNLQNKFLNHFASAKKLSSLRKYIEKRFKIQFYKKKPIFNHIILKYFVCNTYF